MPPTAERDAPPRRVPVHPPLHASPNGDEDAYPRDDGRPSRAGCFSKGLAHDRRGVVRPEAYGSLRRALATRRPDHLAEIVLGGGGRRLGNPAAALPVEAWGPSPARLRLPAPPRLDGRDGAAEMAELLWMALLRDVPFVAFDRDRDVEAAVEDLARVAGAPRSAAFPTPATLFRGLTARDAVGPPVSQLLLRAPTPARSPAGAPRRTAVPGHDHATDWDAFLALQNGADRRGAMRWDPTPRLVRGLRDLAAVARDDVPPQAPFLDAALLLPALGARPAVPDPGRRRAPATASADPRLLDLVGEVSGRALRAVWWQKWFVHRRARPEAVGGLLHRALIGVDGPPEPDVPLHPDLLASRAPVVVRDRHGSALLPLAWPEGAPLHPSYGSAHAAVAGACATVLKAWFAEGEELGAPVAATADGLALTAADAPPLTVGGELDKLAANVALGRVAAGVARRSDAHAGLRLGEEVALAVLARREAHAPVVRTVIGFDGRLLSAAEAA